MILPFLLLTVGAPASGKNTWCQRHFPPGQILSLDQARELVCDDMTSQAANRQAKAVMHAILAGRVAHRRGTVLANTSTTDWERREATALARAHNIPTAAVVFRTPLDECLRRNAARERHVPTDAVESKWRTVAANLPLGRPATETDWTCWIDDRDGTVRYAVEPPEPFASQSWFTEARKEVVQ